jgi:hypothetical protein
MKEKIDKLLERTRKLNSPYVDEKATNAQLSELAKVVEELLLMLKGVGEGR